MSLMTIPPRVISGRRKKGRVNGVNGVIGLFYVWLSTTMCTIVTRAFVVHPRYPWQHSVHNVATLQPTTWLQHWSLPTLLFSSRTSSSSSSTRAPNFDSKDPFVVLGLTPSPSLDKKEIKRAYKRLALQYHPDVYKSTTVNNSNNNNNNNNSYNQQNAAEKKAASDRFAKINWAYQTLMGQTDYSASTSTSTSSTGTGRSSASSNWSPPHRRSGQSYTTSSSSSSSTDWNDYMPRYDDDEQYDTNGDSFGAIFSDLFTGAAQSVAGGTAGVAGAGARIFTDFIEFLEQNVDGYTSRAGSSSSFGTSSSSDDAQLRDLLRTGSLQEVGDEMDDTELVLQQLQFKLRTLENDLLQVKADLKLTNSAATNYLEKLELEERAAELQARVKVVDGYVKKAQKRLLMLQVRYKEMIVNGDNDWRVSGASGGGTGSTSGRRSSSTYRTENTTPYSSSSSSSTSRPHHDKKEDAWKDESFGSYGRGRGSSRRRNQQQQQPSSSSSSYSTSTGPRSTQSSSSSSASTGPRSTQSSSSYNYRARPASSTSDTNTSSQRRSNSESSTPNEPFVPPHRRASTTKSTLDEQRRMREFKVDEEFDKLKKELGLK